MEYAPESLRDRTKAFAIRIVRLLQALPQTTAAQVMGKQVLRSGTSVAANFRSACRARSRREFASRLGVVVEEADETLMWLELLSDTGIVRPERMTAILDEAHQLTAIFTAARETARRKRGKDGTK